ncbi:Ig-like domain-containing protein [Cohnella herbarum]|uniref:BIG2 domain-containing protein n=1 Tax=Cohnella herbarum TaxID=2728023 RepID=A0A7Z2VQA8_9BACL|nr:Ig-like domain-containing protein [Cohnella herbarum]QJD87164.1 hypothetical protein HH215_30975 [Cohnella herbarum]
MKMWSKTEKHPELSSRPSYIYNRILSMILVLALIGSTFGGVASAADEVVTGVHIDPQSSSNIVYVDDNSIILFATADISGGSGTTNRNVTDEATWSSTSSLIKVAKGVVTATGVVSSATITARYKDKTDTYSVSSQYYYNDVKLKIDSVDAPDKQDVNLGPDLTFVATGTKSDSAIDTLTDTAVWTSSNSNVATVSKGVVKLLTAGETTITVKSKGKSDSIVLTVKSPYEKIEINNNSDQEISSPIDITIGASNDRQLKAKAVYKSGASGPVDITNDTTWTSSNSAVAKISEKGLMTAVGAGTAVISAKRFGSTDSVTVIVRTEFEALKITPEKTINVTLYGAKVELTASASSGKELNKPVTDLAEWKISDADQAVAVIEKDSNTKRVYVVPKGTGTAQITASYLGLSKTISITVSPTITTVEIEKDSLDVFVEDTATLPAVNGKTVAGDTKDIGKFVEWTSSDTSIVKIEDGKLKALKAGTVTLSATLEGASGTPDITDTITVNVHKKILALIPSEETISVVIGKEVELPKVQLIYEDGSEDPISDKIVWKSSTPKLLVTSTKLKGLLATTATLTGTYLNQTVKIKVTVEEEFISFAIEPKKISTTLKRSQTVKVTGTTKSGKKVSLGSRIDWHPSSEEHVTVKGSSVKGVEEGSGKLTATVQGKSLEVPYVVTAKLSKLTASNTSFATVAGAQHSVELTALYENGKTANVTTQATWVSSKAAVATVSDGRISVISKGSATIKGTFGGKSVTIRVSVK